jgi:hypothetical protein
MIMKTFFKICAALCTVFLPATATLAGGNASPTQTIDDTDWTAMTDDRMLELHHTNVTYSVVAMARFRKTLYAGGGFYPTGNRKYPIRYLARWDGSGWSGLGAGVNGEVRALACDSLGNLYAGGFFDSAGSVSARHIAKWDGKTWSALGSGMDSVVNALAVDAGGRLFAGGEFSLAGATSAHHIAMWDGMGWSALGEGTGACTTRTFLFRSFVSALAFDKNGNVYAGGNFNFAGGVPINNVARWDGEQWHALGGGLAGKYGNVIVDALAFDSRGSLYAGGSFEFADGQTADRIAKWDGERWSSLGSGLGTNSGAEVWTILPDDRGNIYVGGYLRISYGNMANGVAKWDGAEWHTLGSGMNADTAAVEFVCDLDWGWSGQLFAGGIFVTAGSAAANGIAQWDGAVWKGLSTAMNDTVLAIIPDDRGNFYAAGAFTDAGGVAANRVAAGNACGWSALGAGMDDIVYALALDSRTNTLYAGGEFAAAGGMPARRVAKWDGSGWSPLGSGMNAAVRALALDSGGTLYAGGNFDSAGGVAAGHIARWNGSEWSAVGEPLDDDVICLTFDCRSGTLYAGGVFEKAGSAAVNSIARWDGAAWKGLGAGMDDGFFTRVEGSLIRGIARWNGAAWSALGKGIVSSKNFSNIAGLRALAVDGAGEVFAGGIFDTAGGMSARYMAKWDGSGWSTLGSGVDDEVRALAVSGSTMLVGGRFGLAGGRPSGNIAAVDIHAPSGVIPAARNHADRRAPLCRPISGGRLRIAGFTPGDRLHLFDLSGRCIFRSAASPLLRPGAAACQPLMYRLLRNGKAVSTGMIVVQP